LQKEGTGGDNLAVGWIVPNTSAITVIPGSQLSPFVVVANPVASVPLRLNSGGPTVVAEGITFFEDKYFSTPSGTSLHQKEVAGTNRDIMYVDYRHAATDGGSFSYNIPLNNGTYIVHLNFAEVFHTTAGKRVFSVNLEGGTVELANFDVYGAAGSSTAITKIYTVTVTDGMLNVDFTSQVGKAMIGALQVLPASSARIAAGEDVQEAVRAQAYPNPFTDKLTIALAGEKGKVLITLTDVVGKGHYSTTQEVAGGGELEIDLAAIPLKAGTYLIRLQTEDGRSRTVRVIKK